MYTTTSKISEVPSMAASIIGSNEDLLSKIFSRLPGKPFCRFSCVSRLCNSITRRLRHRISRETCKRVTGLFVYRRKVDRHVMSEYDIIQLHEFEEGPGLSFIKSFKYDNHEPLKIKQSCNGLLCCQTCDSETSLYNFYVCNPTTLQATKLPDPIHAKFCRTKYIVSVTGVFLAYDPRKSPHYKVLCVYTNQTRETPYQVEIYSSETGQWRRAGDPFAANNIFFYHGVYWNGAINWVSHTSDGLYFNVDEERSGKLPKLPRPDVVIEGIVVNRSFMYFGESNDHLYLMESDYHPERVVNIFEMDKEYSGWLMRYTIDFDSVMDVCGMDRLFSLSSYGMFSVLSVVSGGINKDSYAVIFSQRGPCAIQYNLVNKSCKKICDFGGDIFESSFGRSYYYAFHYIESICSV